MAPGPAWAMALIVVASDLAGRRLGAEASVAFRESEEPGANLDGQQGACSGEDDVQGIEAPLVPVQPLAKRSANSRCVSMRLAGESVSMKSRTMALGLAVNVHPGSGTSNESDSRTTPRKAEMPTSTRPSTARRDGSEPGR
jgi:hypothetical protein